MLTQATLTKILVDLVSQPASTENNSQANKNNAQGPGHLVKGLFRTFGTGEQLGLATDAGNAITFGTVEQH